MVEKSEIAADELRNLVQAGVEREKLKILIEDFKDHKVVEEQRLMTIDRNIADIFELVRKFPDRINQCRDDLESDIHVELEKHYTTEADFNLFKLEMNAKIDSITNRFKWTVALIVSLAGSLQFVMTITYLSYKITGAAL